MQAAISLRMAQSVMNRYLPPQMQWHYEYGLVLQSIFLKGKQSGLDALCGYVKSMYDAIVTAKGEILSYRENEYNLDQINPGKVLFLLNAQYGEARYRIAIEKLMGQLRNHPRTNAGGFWHKQIYPWQMWLDGLYMQGPFYAQYTAEYGNARNFEDIVHQFTLIESKARDSETGLLYHAWDESHSQKWANPQTGCSPHFWGRSLGWYCMALVDTVELLPQKEALIAITQRLLAPLLQYQDEGGLWFQVLDRKNEKNNYTESSASAMFIYFLLKMLRLNLVPEKDIETVKAAAINAYKGLLEQKVREEPSGELHLNGICKVAGLGGNPYRNGSYEYYVNEPVVADDFKGIGPFILASMEYESLSVKQPTPLQAGTT